jgi:hypothetical protein
MTTQKIEWIIWNGCDGYDMAECGDIVWTRTSDHNAMEVVAVADADIPADIDGQPDFDGLFIANGRVFRHA